MRDGGVRRLRGDPRALRRLGRLGRAASFRRAGIDRLGRERRRRRHRAPTSLSRGGDQSEMPPVVVLGAQRARVLVRVLHLLRGRAPRVRQHARQRRPRRLRLHPRLRLWLRRFRLCSRRRAFPAPSRTFPSSTPPCSSARLRAPTPTRLPSPVARAVARRRGPTRPTPSPPEEDPRRRPRPGTRARRRRSTRPPLGRVACRDPHPRRSRFAGRIRIPPPSPGPPTARAATATPPPPRPTVFFAARPSRFSVAAIRRAATRRRSARRIAATRGE